MNGRCDRCGKTLVSTDCVNELCRDCDNWLITHTSNHSIPVPSPATGVWRTDEPPKDGLYFLTLLSNKITRSECFPSPDILWRSHDSERFYDGNNHVIEQSRIIAWAEINPYEETK